MFPLNSSVVDCHSEMARNAVASKLIIEEEFYDKILFTTIYSCECGECHKQFQIDKVDIEFCPYCGTHFSGIRY